MSIEPKVVQFGLSVTERLLTDFLAILLGGIICFFFFFFYCLKLKKYLEISSEQRDPAEIK